MEESADFFEKVCRVCTLEKKSLISIQTPTETIKYDIPSKLMACADINVITWLNLCFKLINYHF